MAVDLWDADKDVAMPVASNDETRIEIREIEGEAHAVVVRVDVGQRSGPSVQCFPHSHARFLCKVAASVRRPNCRGDVSADPTEVAYSAARGDESARCRKCGSAGTPRVALRLISCSDAGHAACGNPQKG